MPGIGRSVPPGTVGGQGIPIPAAAG